MLYSGHVFPPKTSFITLIRRYLSSPSPFDIGARAILLEDERTYAGIEKRLNDYMATQYSLLEMIDVIKNGEFYADMQHHLNIVVEDITDNQL